jgi:hypothetical protein
MMRFGSPMNIRAAVLALTAGLLTAVASGQAAPAGTSAPSPSRFEVFGGYSYLGPFSSDVYNQKYFALPFGITASGTGYFNRSFGLQGEYSKYPNDPDYCYSDIEGGPVFRHQMGRLVPFVHVLAGTAEVGPAYQHGGPSNRCVWGWAFSGGGGLDYILPAWHNRVAIRPIQADFVFDDINYGPRDPTQGILTGGGSVQITAVKLSAGVVFRFGEVEPPLPAAYACTAEPVNIYPGEPVTVTGSAVNLDSSKKLRPVYSWATTGGQIAGVNETATISTAGLAPGDYAITGKVNEGKEATQHADCSTSFRVNAFEPPTISCSASPNSIMPGGVATITASGRSPQNRPLNFSYAASAGQISGTGQAANYSAAGVSPGVVNITCNTVDDLGKSAVATTKVTILEPPAPPPAPKPVTRALCSLSFERDKARPVRVDNEAKGCLDDVALALNRESDATLVVVGRHDPSETPEAAAERTLNVKQYLTVEKGIDPARIDLRTGDATGRSVDTILVPAGATWDPGSTTGFDPASVKRKGQPYAKPR